MPEHPMQPLVRDDQGVIRFKENEIVRLLLDFGPYDLNDIAVMDFSQEDREQFVQLIGYSVSGFGDLGFVREEIVQAADKLAEEFNVQP